MSLPKFLYSKSDKGDEYITYVKMPTIGMVEDIDGQVRVNLIKTHPALSEAELHQLTLDMKNWYYFKFRS